MRPSSQQPIPLRRRRDVVVEWIKYRDVAYAVIKDPCGLKYAQLQPEQYEIWSLLDGQRPLEELRDLLQKSYPSVHLTLLDVQSLINDLHEKQLLVSERPGQGRELIEQRRTRKWKAFWAAVRNPMNLTFPGWDPDRSLTFLHALFGWLFTAWAVTAVALVLSGSALFLMMRVAEIRQRLPEFQQFFAWPNLVYLWLTMGAIRVLHEFGHGLACKHFGGECHKMGVMLLVFSPTLYCDASDAGMLRSKWQRIMVSAGGMYFEIILSLLAFALWWHSQPGLLQNICLNIFFISTVTTVLFNANPLLRFDGYFILVDWLEIPNLRPQASQMLQQTFAWWCLGIKLPQDPFLPTSGWPWFLLFTVASFVYRWMVSFGIIVYLYTVLKPYRLQNIGIMLAWISAGTAVFGLGYSLYQLLKMPRHEPLSRTKIAVSLLLLAGLIGGGLLVPVPWYIHAPLTIEPVAVEHVFTRVPGQLVELHGQPGDWVQLGEPIATLSAIELEDRLRELTLEREVRRVEPATYRQLNQPDEMVLAEDRLRTVEEQIRDAQTLLEQAIVRAPLSGRIVAARRSQPPPIDQKAERLPRWSGTPLSPKNVGAYFEQRTQLCSIAPSDRFAAVLLVDQVDRDDVAVGQTVRLKLDELPHLVLEGVVTAVSDRHLEFAPPELSNKFQGPLATVSDAEGREKLLHLTYQATVPLDLAADQFRSGMRGEARVIIAQRTAGQWIWRWLRSTFHFRL